MPKFRQGRDLKNWKTPRARAEPGRLRIIGGEFRGRQIAYSGDPVTRPMKDNIREALFNLVGGWVKGRAAFDLFAGTGAVGLEAISRGATRAYLVERHFPTVRLIRQNVNELGSDLPVTIVASDTFFWIRDFLKQPESHPREPWMVFCCPPYALFNTHRQRLMDSLASLIDVAPERSLFVVESDDSFDAGLLPQPEHWHVRQYSPAQVSVYRRGVSGFDEEG